MCGFIVTYDEKVKEEDVKRGLDEINFRGPDKQNLVKYKNCYLGFNRLSIMDLENSGMQPFEFDNKMLVCNGEIYGFRKIKEDLIKKGYIFKSNSDCEVLLYMYKEFKFNMFKKLDAEFALVIFDENKIIAARDPIGIRPMFYGYTISNKIVFASETKALIKICKDVYAFPPGYYYDGEKFIKYIDITRVRKYYTGSIDEICSKIHDKLVLGVEKRLDSDAPIGFLLSGGLDSSLVCSIATKKLKKPIRTFAIGMEKDAIDLKYAKQVANYINSSHTEVIINKSDVINSLDEVIYHLESYDITTVRASIGMYLLCKWIRENTDIKVILTGEVSDELFGYKYTDFAPSAKEFQKESKKRVDELYMYDVLRADRCISANSLEARVPFADLDFVKFVMSINPEIKLNKYNKGKYLLRYAFKDNYLPEEILMREKAAFSDAVGHSLADYLKEYASKKYTDSYFEKESKKYKINTPFTKEALLYREIFEKYYSNKAHLIKDFWMPNKNWPNCNVLDPSARVLKNYGDSGK